MSFVPRCTWKWDALYTPFLSVPEANLNFLVCPLADNFFLFPRRKGFLRVFPEGKSNAVPSFRIVFHIVFFFFEFAGRETFSNFQIGTPPPPPPPPPFPHFRKIFPILPSFDGAALLRPVSHAYALSFLLLDVLELALVSSFHAPLLLESFPLTVPESGPPPEIPARKCNCFCVLRRRSPLWNSTAAFLAPASRTAHSCQRDRPPPSRPILLVFFLPADFLLMVSGPRDPFLHPCGTTFPLFPVT